MACSNGEPTSMPRQRLLRRRPRPVSPQAAAIASNVPPTVSVAEVSTTVDCSKSLPRNRPATDSGATRMTRLATLRRGCPRGRATPRRCGPGSAGTNDARIRDAVSLMSVSAVTASARAGGGLRVAGRRVDRRAGLARRRRATRSGRCAISSSRRSMRPGVGIVDRRRERRRRRLQTLRQFGFDEPGDAPRWATPSARRRQLGGGHAGHPVHQFVGLVDDEQLGVRAARRRRRWRRWPAARGW